jgi:mono/diheme cytochrome c family protein
MKAARGYLGAAVLGAAVLYVAIQYFSPSAAPPPIEARPMVAVNVPVLVGEALAGQEIFAARCAQCHGEQGAGLSGIGPPLIHKIYEPSHHDDSSFFRAVQFGVVAHHWGFGPMAPVANISQDEIAAVISYVRTVQRANGIF